VTGPHLPGCFACEQDQRTDLPPRERVSVTEHWRVAHAFDSALSGWLVVLPRRHVEAIAKLQREEAAELGPLLTDLSRAWAR
jgi:diadenosine tetraphosphate (Ap4A) HIT family hydrolase